MIPKGLLVDIHVDDETNIEGFVPLSHLALPHIQRTEDVFVDGDQLPLKVIELDMENRRFILSVRAYFFGLDIEQLQTYKERILEHLKASQEEDNEAKEENIGGQAQESNESQVSEDYDATEIKEENIQEPSKTSTEENNESEESETNSESSE